MQTPTMNTATETGSTSTTTAGAAASDSSSAPSRASSPVGARPAADTVPSDGPIEGPRGPRRCSHDGCGETTSRAARQAASPARDHPWMCKRHKNKAYKAKFKTKKTFAGGSGGGKDKKELASGSSQQQQRRGSAIREPAIGRKATMLESVLNRKRQALLKSPAVMQALRGHQLRCHRSFATDADHQL